MDVATMILCNQYSFRFTHMCTQFIIFYFFLNVYSSIWNNFFIYVFIVLVPNELNLAVILIRFLRQQMTSILVFLEMPLPLFFEYIILNRIIFSELQTHYSIIF